MSPDFGDVWPCLEEEMTSYTRDSHPPATVSDSLSLPLSLSLFLSLSLSLSPGWQKDDVGTPDILKGFPNPFDMFK